MMVFQQQLMIILVIELDIWVIRTSGNAILVFRFFLVSLERA